MVVDKCKTKEEVVIVRTPTLVGIGWDLHIENKFFVHIYNAKTKKKITEYGPFNIMGELISFAKLHNITRSEEN